MPRDNQIQTSRIVSSRLSRYSEGLCDEPQKTLMRAMLVELWGMLDEFEEAYFGS